MFDDIRPYRDNEVEGVINELINATDLQSSIAIFKMPILYKIVPSLARKMVKMSLKRIATKLHTVDDIQKEVVKYLYHVLKTSTSNFTYQGLERLSSDQPTLFISNHRDIVLDAALVNLALHQSGFSTVEAAVGDNLLSQSWVSDLMRINKSFVVKRNEKTKRAMLQASKQLSSYIHFTLNENKQNIWIAQREGRAKDGLDKTNAALISMLMLNKPKDKTIADYLPDLNIVPVAISYEFDPCDRHKAKELAALNSDGEYKKQENEDLKSITKGIIGDKGHVHISFGSPLKGEYIDSKAIALAIDRDIISHYKLFDSNINAYQYLHENQSNNVALLATMQNRLEGLNAQQKDQLLHMYANPVLAKKHIQVVLND